ncbi:hypothetical protein [Enterobacter sp.]|uniref:hypothetical protein n=1 Tax=Enterobacter sp. TaxID=42895 RepID=UPI0031DA4ED7
MFRKSILLPALCVLVIAMVCVFAMFFFMRHDDPERLQCESDLFTRKDYTSGGYAELALKTIVLINNSNSMTIVHKGMMTTPASVKVVDQTFTLDIEKVNKSNIYLIVKKVLRKSPDNSSPDDIINQLQLDNINMFYLTQVKHNAWVLNGLMLPIMMCVDI